MGGIWGGGSQGKNAILKSGASEEIGIHCENMETLFRVACYWQMVMYKKLGD
jgi:hypothetical protein